MKLAIMQPYLFPYIGYYSLAASVDVLVLRDVAQFPKGGWVNRNRLEFRHGIDWFTVPVQKVTEQSKISDLMVTEDWSPVSLRRKIEPALFRAEHRSLVLNLIESLPSSADKSAVSLIKLLTGANLSTLRLLAAECEIIFESSLGLDPLPGIEGVMQICNKLGATYYHNLPGGRKLYSKSQFMDRDIGLRFIEPKLTPYARGTRRWVPSLSILDVLSQTGEFASKRLVETDYELD